MSTQLKLRRGTTAQHSTFTGAEGEVTVDTTKDTLVVHDAMTVGGHPMAKEAKSIQKDSDTGAATIPSGTTAQRKPAPVFGDQRANSTLTAMEWWNGIDWVPMGGGATGGGTDHVFVNTEYTINNSYLIPAGKSSVIVSDSSNNVYFAAGVQIDFSTGSKVVIL